MSKTHHEETVQFRCPACAQFRPANEERCPHCNAFPESRIQTRFHERDPRKPLSTTAALIVGFFSLLPIAVLIPFNFLVFYLQGIGEMDEDTVVSLLFFVNYQILVYGLSLAGYFIWRLMQDPNLPGSSLAIWIFCLVFFSFLAFPIYWYDQIWKPTRAVRALNDSEIRYGSPR